MVEIKETKETLGKKYLEVGFVGTIGAGKTTLSGVLARRWGIETVEENYPLNPFLADFYKDPYADGASFKSQFWFMTHKIEQLKNVDINQVRIIDPSLVMDKLYAKTHHKMGFMKDEEWNLYQGAFDILSSQTKIPYPDMFVIVTADMSDLKQRIIDRGRPYEKWLLENEKYLKELQISVEEWAAIPEKGVYKLHINTSSAKTLKDIELNANRVEHHICAEFGIQGKHVLPKITPPKITAVDYYIKAGNESIGLKK